MAGRGRRRVGVLVLVASVLALSGVGLASGANASVPGVSKKCQSFNTLNAKLDKALSSGDTGKVDTGAVNDVAKGYRSAAKTAPKSLKSAMNTIADVATSVSHTSSPLAAAAALKKAGPKITAAVVTWARYLATSCAGATTSTP